MYNNNYWHSAHTHTHAHMHTDTQILWHIMIISNNLDYTEGAEKRTFNLMEFSPLIPPFEFQILLKIDLALVSINKAA